MKISDEMLRQNAAQARELWLDTLPQKDELPDYSVSPAFEENLERLLRKGRRAEKRKSFFQSLGRVAAVLLLVSALSFAGLMTVDAAFREKVLQVFIQVFPEHTQFDYIGSQEDAVLPELRLDALPEGFAVLSDERFDQQSRQLHCEDAAGHCLDIDIVVISANGVGTHHIDTEDAQVREMDIQGRKVTVVAKNGLYILMWTEDSTVFTIFSDYALSELIPLIEGMTSSN